MPSPTQILQQYWGYDAFRPLQEDIISSILAGQDTLALMPTGGGKSICFQVPALLNEGICIVVSPLIALMQDQVAQLHKRDIPAVAIYSGMHRSQIDIALDNCIYGNTKFLYVSPERLQSKLLIERVKQMKVNLLAIDEAHCVSQWGYDFRPPYLQIAEFRKLLPNVPLIALTATATQSVKLDITEKLAMANAVVFQQSFARANLSYSTFQEEDKERKLLTILEKVQGSAVVYVRNRKRTQEMAEMLNRYRIGATFYHAGLAAAERTKRQTAWIKNQTRVMVATNAFGMGIDKPDVRTVIHLDLPDTLEAYYQEAGRAGRDGHKAFAVALFNLSDVEGLERNILKTYPASEVLRQTYQALGNYFQLAIGAGELASFDFDLFAFQQTYQLSGNETFYALKKLEDLGYIQLGDAFNSPSKLLIQVDNKDLYDFQLKNPRYDGFIKLLLRMYGGEIFTNYTTISETTISKYFNAPIKEVEQMLGYLEKLQMLHYDKQKDKPQLTFLTPRMDAKTMPLNIQEMENRKQLALEKARSVAHYMKHGNRCRTQLLLEYFGEITDAQCGNCDNCLAKKKVEQAQEKQQMQRQKIAQLLANGAMSTDLIVQIMAPIPAKHILENIREMLGNEQIKYNAEGNLERVGNRK